MSTHTIHPDKDCFYFITFTCHKWIRLFQLTSLEDYLMIWMHRLNEKGILMSAYVMMPNHLHLLVFVDKEAPNLNKTIGEAKRFMAYEIVKRLDQLEYLPMLRKLKFGVARKEKSKGKLHQVFRPSFDAKMVVGSESLQRVSEYIHHNPVKGKWKLVEDFALYPFSSAAHYYLDKKNPLIAVDFREY